MNFLYSKPSTKAPILVKKSGQLNVPRTFSGNWLISKTSHYFSLLSAHTSGFYFSASHQKLVTDTL